MIPLPTQVQDLDLYKQNRPRMTVQVHQLDLYEHPKRINYSTIVLIDCGGRVKGFTPGM